MIFVGMGRCSYEMIGVVERIPLVGTTEEFLQFSIQGSGVAANALALLAHWGETTRFVGKVGDDVRGREIIDGLAAEGVNTEWMVQQPGGISQIKCLLAEENQPGFRIASTDGTVSDLTIDDFDPYSPLAEASYLLVDARYPRTALALAELASEKNIYVFFYADELSLEHEPILPLVDHVIASERIAGRYFRHSRLEDICEEFLGLGPNRVTITIGSEGVVGKEKNGEYLVQPTLPVDFVDSLGANGAFLGAIAYANAHEMSFQRSLEFANVAAAMSCAGFGPRSNIPSLDEVTSKRITV